MPIPSDGFALETLYRWLFLDTENEHLYSVCDAKSSLGLKVFDDFQKKHEFENIVFLDSIKKCMNSQGARNGKVHENPMFLNGSPKRSLFRK